MTAQEDDEEKRSRSRRRARVFKDLLVFQFKLMLEGLKDIVLGPLSLGAAALDFILAKEAPVRYLDAVMRLGQRFEETLDLYALGDHSADAIEREASESVPPSAAAGPIDARDHASQP